MIGLPTVVRRTCNLRTSVTGRCFSASSALELPHARRSSSKDAVRQAFGTARRASESGTARGNAHGKIGQNPGAALNRRLLAAAGTKRGPRSESVDRVLGVFLQGAHYADERNVVTTWDKVCNLVRDGQSPPAARQLLVLKAKTEVLARQGCFTPRRWAEVVRYWGALTERARRLPGSQTDVPGWQRPPDRSCTEDLRLGKALFGRGARLVRELDQEVLPSVLQASVRLQKVIPVDEAFLRSLVAVTANKLRPEDLTSTRYPWIWPCSNPWI